MIKAAIDYYHELLSQGNYAQTTQELLTQATESQGLAFGKRPICTVLRPYFIDETTYKFVKQQSALVMNGIALLREHLLADAKLRKELDLTAEEEEIVQLEYGYGAPDVSGRLDGFLSPTGEFNFVEYNAESPGGLAYGDALSRVFADMPIMQAFQERYSYRTLPIKKMVYAALLGAFHRWGGRTAQPNIAIIDWRGVSTYNEFLLSKAYFEAQGCQVRIADPDELEFRNNRLYVGDFPVDLVYKRVLIGEFLAKFGLNHPLITAIRANAVCIANAFRVQMIYKKTCFALLSDPQYHHLYADEIVAALTRHIPWTRKVRQTKTSYQDQTIDLVDFISQNQHKLVLKPNGEYGGKGVVLGWEVDAPTWAETLQNALTSTYIVQERVPLGCEVYPSIIEGKLSFDERFLDLDPYVWNGTQIEGCGVRLSKLALLNVTAGGGSATPMFIINKH